MTKQIFAIIVALLVSSTAHADSIERLKPKRQQIEQRQHRHSSPGTRDGAAHSVPELDKNVASSAAVLIGGGLLVLLGRKRRKHERDDRASSR